jgi:hypothetical protein
MELQDESRFCKTKHSAYWYASECLGLPGCEAVEWAKQKRIEYGYEESESQAALSLLSLH